MAAVRLARAGASVTLFDPSHPREKPCGGGLTGRALALVADVIDIDALPAVVVNAATVEGAEPQRRAVRIDRSRRRPRTARSSWSAARSSTARSPMRRWPPGRASSRNERWTSRRAVRAWWFAPIAREYEADTCSAPTARTASCARSSRARSRARSSRSPPASSSMARRRRRIAIKTMHEPPGYLWSFPRPDHLAVGVCAAAAHHASSAQLRAQSAAWIQQHGLHRGTTLDAVRLADSQHRL